MAALVGCAVLSYDKRFSLDFVSSPQGTRCTEVCFPIGKVAALSGCTVLSCYKLTRGISLGVLGGRAVLNYFVPMRRMAALVFCL